MRPNLDGRVALVTGGTKGIGLATAMELSRCGAQVVVTHRWGSVEEEQLQAIFRDEALTPPMLIEADATSAADTVKLMKRLAETTGALDIFISNAANAVVIDDFADYNRRAFLRTMESSAWPTFEHLSAHKAQFDSYPRHVVVMSSSGSDHFAPGYDFMGASKAALEALCRYCAHRLHGEGVNINVLRSRGVRTDALEEVFGPQLWEFAARYVDEEHDVLEAKEVAGVAVALCSGLLDGMNGQVVTADKGTQLEDNIMHRFEAHAGLDT